jgi:uncharacterized protein (TIGR02996 family)
LLAIQECLDDDLPRRALADWLEEHGDARAELLRAGLGGDLKRLWRWWAVYGERWCGALPAGARVEVPNGLLTLVWPAGLFRAPPDAVPDALRAAVEQGWLFRLVLDGLWGVRSPRPPCAGDVLLDRVTVVRWKQATRSWISTASATGRGCSPST